MKQTADFAVDNCSELKIKMLNWANQFSIFCLLDNHQYQPIAIGFEKPAFECLVGAGCKRNIVMQAGNAFEKLRQFSDEKKGWLFGHFAYDLKNEIEQLQSLHPDGTGFPDLHFFEPEIVLELFAGSLRIHSYEDPKGIFATLLSFPSTISTTSAKRIDIKNRIQRSGYIDIVEKLKSHIARGDGYEINFCQEFFAENVLLQPVEVYSKLSVVSPNPFSALYKLNDKYCICASPERYLQKKGTTIISQPIKGTSKRDLHNCIKDAAGREYLTGSEKEKSENTMVVDLVRNDFSKVCVKGSVVVRELHGVYSFPQVHQMISTIEGKVDNGTHWANIVKATFPMGSMTGVPKKKVMELIEKYELSKRGLFSGAIGYVKPDGDFDFNVVIRSILYNQSTGYLSYTAGSAITFQSHAIDEYNECLVKVAAIKKILEAAG